MRPRDIPLIERSGLPPQLTTKCSLTSHLDPVDQSYKQLSDLCNLKKVVIPLIDVETDSVIQFTCQLQNAGPVKNKENISSNARISGNHSILKSVSPYQRTIKNYSRLFPRIKIKSHNTGSSYLTSKRSGKPFMCNIEAQSNKIPQNDLVKKAEKLNESIKNNVTVEPKIVLERLSDDVVKQYETSCTKRGEPVVVLHRLSLDVLKQYNVDTSKWNRRFKSRKVKILQKNKLYFQHLNYKPVLLACEARSHNTHKDQTNRNALLRAQKPLSSKNMLRKQLCRNFGVVNKKKVNKTALLKWQEQQLLRFKKWEMKNYGWSVHFALEETRKYIAAKDKSSQSESENHLSSSIPNDNFHQFLDALGLSEKR